jgi:class 3 adenylate cyclase/tetratricopeptide (TPR) repeat protein
VTVDGVCQSCSEPLPDGARFCPSCGARLDAPRAAPAERTERRLISTLFCDLVGFTAIAERGDPEDVDALLRPFYALAREVIEQHGGVVEKYIGDAVVGVFGVPRAHEDDPERAVRAAVRLQRRLGELPHDQGEPLLARIGVDTGRALVRLDVDPLAGESFQAGDAVVKASRLQALAPPGGIVVGETTHSMAAHVAEYEALPHVKLRGRQALERPWLVTGGVAQLGVELRREEAAAFVGREVELGVLTGLFEKSMSSASPQTVLVTGEAGIGKSRLLSELARRLDARPDMLAQWRQARCGPFDEGSGLWPLAQILREHAGVVAGDDDVVVKAKLERSVPATLDEPWLQQRLLALLGSGGAWASREENFAAWARFIDSMARAHPTVLVVEDIQWASSTMAEFLQYLFETVDDVPLLTILTGRPELLDDVMGQRPPIAGDRPRMTMELHPLSERETARLVALLLRDVEADVSAAVIANCGGNPLYAEEIARFLADRAVMTAARVSMIPELLPASLESLIAARLDTLGEVERAVLADAAVVGLRFWRDVLHTMSEAGCAAVDDALARLADVELIRPLVGPAASAAEFAFWHAVVRDVAYAMLPRKRRATRHRDVAAWLQRHEAGRSRPGLIAHHLTTAFEAAQQADATLAGSLLEPAVEAHVSAALQTQPVDMRGAEQHLVAAAALMPPGHPRHPWVTIERGDALSHIGHLDEARSCIEQGVREAERNGDLEVVVHGRARLASLLNWMGDTGARTAAESALDLLDRDGASDVLVTALEEQAMSCVIAFRADEAIAAADAALRAAATLDAPKPARALLWRGAARCDQGDAGGLEDFEEALQLIVRQGRSRDLSPLYYNYAEALLVYQGTGQSIGLCRAGVDDMLQRGDVNGANALRGGMCYDLMWAGEWDEVLAHGEELERRLERAGDLQMVAEMRTLRALLALLQGDTGGARETTRGADEVIRDSFAFGNHAWSCTSFLSAVHHGTGNGERALSELTELEEATRGKRAAIANGLPFALRTLASLDAVDLAERLLDGLPIRPFELAVHALWRALSAEGRACWDEATRAYRDAEARWHALGFVHEEALAKLGSGRCLVQESRRAEAVAPLSAAHAVFVRLGTPEAGREASTLLSQTTARRP